MDALIELFLKCEKNSFSFFQSSPSSHIRVKVVALNDFADIIRFCNSIFLPFFCSWRRSWRVKNAYKEETRLFLLYSCKKSCTLTTFLRAIPNEGQFEAWELVQFGKKKQRRWRSQQICVKLCFQSLKEFWYENLRLPTLQRLNQEKVGQKILVNFINYLQGWWSQANVFVWNFGVNPFHLDWPRVPCWEMCGIYNP